MKAWFIEVMCVVLLSKRIQWAIVLGVVSFIGINLLGSYMVSNFELVGPLKGAENVIAEKLLHRYDKAALFALISFWALAFKFYHRDKKRLL